VGRQGIEPWTYGLKEPSTNEELREVASERDRVVTLAESVLRQATEGAVAREDAEKLAREWLAITGADLAMQVLMGGAHEAARLVELCGCVLRTLGGQLEAVREGGGQ
jgi:hypothetical protein